MHTRMSLDENGPTRPALQKKGFCTFPLLSHVEVAGKAHAFECFQGCLKFTPQLQVEKEKKGHFLRQTRSSLSEATMKGFIVILLIALSVQASLPGGLATKTRMDEHLTISSGALGALVMVKSSSTLADAFLGRRRRRRGCVFGCGKG